MKAARHPRALIGAMLIVGIVAGCSAMTSARPSARPVPRVGLMHAGTDHNPPSLATLVAALGDLHWFDGPATDVMQQLVGDGTMVDGKMKQLQGEYDGERIALIWRNLEKAQSATQSAEFVADHVDVIVAFEDSSIGAAQAATAAMQHPIPVVFLHPSDPVRDGLVESLSHPGGNLTGVFGARDPVVNQLELYKQIMPNLHRLLTLVDRTDKATEKLLEQAKDAASQLSIELDTQETSNADDLERAFHSLTPGEVDGAFILSPSLRLNFSQKIIDLATQAKVPVQAHRKEWLEKGALFSVGVDVGPVGTAAGRFVDSIVRGTPPADLPVEEVRKTEFAINLARARELGIDVSPDVIARADKIYR